MSSQEQRKLTPRQELFVEFYTTVGSPGYGNGNKSAELAGYSGDYQTISSIASENLTKPYIISEIERRKHDLQQRFKTEATNAFDTMVALMNNDRVSPRVRLDACKDILDRAGYKPNDKLELTGKDGSPITYETRQTREIVSRARSLILDIPADIVEVEDNV